MRPAPIGHPEVRPVPGQGPWVLADRDGGHHRRPTRRSRIDLRDVPVALIGDPHMVCVSREGARVRADWDQEPVRRHRTRLGGIAVAERTAGSDVEHIGRAWFQAVDHAGRAGAGAGLVLGLRAHRVTLDGSSAIADGW